MYLFMMCNFIYTSRYSKHIVKDIDLPLPSSINIGASRLLGRRGMILKLVYSIPYLLSGDSVTLEKISIVL